MYFTCPTPLFLSIVNCKVSGMNPCDENTDRELCLAPLSDAYSFWSITEMKLVS